MAPLFLVLFAAGSLLAFQERARKPIELTATLAKIERTHAALFKQAPDLKSPLVRADLQTGPSFLGNNIGLLLGLSSLPGYYPPPPRYLKLLLALNGIPYEPQVINIEHKTLLKPAFPILKELYNVRYSITISHEQLSILRDPENRTFESAWFPKKIIPTRSYEELAALLWKEKKNLSNLSSTAPILASEPTVPMELLQNNLSPNCENSHLTSVEWSETNKEVSVQLKTPDQCLLVIPMNFGSSLHATGFNTHNELIKPNLSMFPAYGALTGVMVSPETTLVKIRSEIRVPLEIRICQLIGCLLLLLAFRLLYSGSEDQLLQETK